MTTIFLSGIVMLGLAVIAVLQCIGFGYLTSDIFNNDNPNNRSTVQKNFIKLGLIMFWINIGLSLLLAFNSSR